MQLTGSRGTTSGDAYAFALQGHGYLLDYHRPGAIDSAIELFQRAQSADWRSIPPLCSEGRPHSAPYA